jgi:glycosyltransferase involved in cell wall biosynthesis
MKLLVLSHPCVEPINRNFFLRVQARSGWSVRIVVPSRWNTEYGKRRAASSPASGSGVIPRPVLFSGNIPLHVYVTRLARLIAREGPQAIYVHHEPYAAATFQVFAASRRAGRVPIGFFSCQNLNKRYPWPFSVAERFVYAWATFALPVSSAVAAVLRQKGYRGPLEVLPFGIDTELYRPTGAEARVSGISKERPTIGYVGRLTREKGIDTFFGALRSLPRERVQAMIVGDGADAALLRGQAAALGLRDRVSWTGYVPHEAMPDIYRALDLLVVPSRTTPTWTEQFGRVVIEALACGTPVVTSDSGELPRLVAATGGGWTFPEGDAVALAALIERCLDRPIERRRRGLRGRAAVVKQFDLDVLADRFVPVVEAAVGGARG